MPLISIYYCHPEAATIAAEGSVHCGGGKLRGSIPFAQDDNADKHPY
jgi:hypothetical protein